MEVCRLSWLSQPSTPYSLRLGRRWFKKRSFLIVAIGKSWCSCKLLPSAVNSCSHMKLCKLFPHHLLSEKPHWPNIMQIFAYANLKEQPLKTIEKSGDLERGKSPPSPLGSSGILMEMCPLLASLGKHGGTVVACGHGHFGVVRGAALTSWNVSK